MRFVPAEDLAEVVGVSRGIVIRWIQSGCLAGVDADGRRGLAISLGSHGVLVEFDALPKFLTDRGIDVDWNKLRTAIVTSNSLPGTPGLDGD